LWHQFLYSGFAKPGVVQSQHSDAEARKIRSLWSAWAYIETLSEKKIDLLRPFYLLLDTFYCYGLLFLSGKLSPLLELNTHITAVHWQYSIT
jgi:hypothetical protein